MSLLPLQVALLCAAVGAEPADATAHPRTVYFTTGDHQDLLGLPLDSNATVEAAFEAIRKLYHVRRVWWRGGQDEVWGKEFIIRPENRIFDRTWDWWKDLQYRKVATNRIAVKASHDLGMEVWMAYGLFDHGSAADVGYVGFPYAAEDHRRAAHPEWAPVNRFGTWRQGGPIEFCYPEARKAVAGYLARYVLDGGYDGIAFLTYAENYSVRYDDEFGFNEPVVAEFKRRHGVDVRRQPFDRDAWSRLRGEYVTAFLRDLHARLAPHKKRVAVCVDGAAPYRATVWGGVRTAGNVHLDLETWAKEGLVDEVTVYASASDAAIRKCVAACRGSATKVSGFRTRGDLPAGMERIMFVNPEVESGFAWEHFVDWPDERISAQPADALAKGDAFARRRLLTAALKGKQEVPSAKVVAAVKDPDVLVRRLALRLLGKTGDRSTIPAVEAALRDPEHSVRWQAALVMGSLPGPRCVELLLGAAFDERGTFQFNYRAVPQTLLKLQKDGKLGEAKSLLSGKLTDPDAKVRELALYYFSQIGAPATPEVEAALLKAVKGDPNPYTRELALANLRSSFGATARVQAATREAMRDCDAAVGARAAVMLASMTAGPGSPPADRGRALRDVTTFFRGYGQGCRRPDASWGWRVVGNALLLFGNDGRQALLGIMQEKDDRRLADLAWRVLYLKQGDQFYPLTLEEDRAAHARHPDAPPPK
jgi:HEAT repeat protein